MLKTHRKAVRSGGEDLISTRELDDGQPLPLMVEPRVEGVDLAAWVGDNLDWIESKLHVNGGVLFRGFGVDTAEAFEESAKAFGHELLPYTERTAPRLELRPHVYTSTEHPQTEYIHFHNANSYSGRWPMKIWFGCLVAPEEGGRTPIADCRRVFQLVDPEIREEFMRRGVTYLRNFREKVGLPWQTSFGTSDPDEVRAYCASQGIEIDLFEGDRLRTRTTRQAVSKHPATGELVWYNQAHLFHVTGLDDRTRNVLLKSYSEEDLPRNTYFGDGGEIPADVLAHVVEAYKEAEVSFPWEVGDFLILDNMLTAHSRTSFKGERLIVVSFAELIEGDRTLASVEDARGAEATAGA
jgi:alpha-ketoglutarate-dependent taurine dioxygenase